MMNFSLRLKATILFSFIVLLSLFLYLRNARKQQPTEETSPISDSSILNLSTTTAVSSLPSSQSYTNEELHQFLDKEKQRMGIQKIILKGQEPPAPESSAQPHDPDGYAQRMAVRRAVMRQMTQELQTIVESRKAPSVKLENKSTPALLPRSGGAQSAPGTPIESSQTPSNPPQ